MSRLSSVELPELATGRSGASRTHIDPFVRHTLHSSKLVVLVSEGTWHPPTDVFETADALVCRVEVAGVRPGDFKILLERSRLTIRGRRPDPATNVRRGFLQMEISFGAFERCIEIPFAIDTDSIQARYDNGFLELILPKAPRGRLSSVTLEITL